MPWKDEEEDDKNYEIVRQARDFSGISTVSFL